MAVFMIGYDLHEGEDYEDLIGAIEALGRSYWHCLDSTWFVISNSDAGSIRDQLKQHMKNPDGKNGDKLLVVQIATPTNSGWTLSFTKECADWLRANFA